jgi:hypothetical protein
LEEWVAINKCPLCTLDKEIVNSHLVPHAMWKRCKAPDSEPILLTSKSMVQTSKEVTTYLLCSDCEGLLNNGGEQWLLPKLAFVDGRFPLLDILRSSPPLFQDPDLTIYAGTTNPKIEVDKLVHFALGVFWKASVDDWDIEHGENLIELGKHTEEIRAFLKEGAPFPQDIVLHLTVSPPPTTLLAFYLPFEAEPVTGLRDNFKLFYFYVCGVLFNLAVGSDITHELKGICLQSSPQHLILVQDVSEKVKAPFQEAGRTAKKTANVMKYMNKPKP